MKTKKFIGALAAMVTVVFMYSCTGGSNTGKMIVKKWKVDSIKSTDFDKEMASLKVMGDTAKDSATKATIAEKVKMNMMFMDAFKNMVVEYKADSTFERTMSIMGQTQTQKGKWALGQDGKALMETDEKQKKDTIIITEITNDKFTICTPDKSMSITYKALK
jgi:outer membrane lipoprotein-sorting protein